jgi:cyanate permease
LADSLGWRWALVVEAGIMLLGVVCGLIYRPIPPPENGEEVKTASNEAKEEVDARCCCCCGCRSSCCSEIIDVSFFKRPEFCIICFSILMFCFGYHVPYAYTPERARQYGVDASSASFLVSIMGMANVGSRLVFGWVADRSPRIRFYLAGTMLTLGGLVSIAIPLFTTYPLMILYSVLFGAFTGQFFSRFNKYKKFIPIMLVLRDIKRSSSMPLSLSSS